MAQMPDKNHVTQRINDFRILMACRMIKRVDDEDKKICDHINKQLTEVEGLLESSDISKHTMSMLLAMLDNHLDEFDERHERPKIDDDDDDTDDNGVNVNFDPIYSDAGDAVGLTSLDKFIELNNQHTALVDLYNAAHDFFQVASKAGFSTAIHSAEANIEQTKKMVLAKQQEILDAINAHVATKIASSSPVVPQPPTTN